MAESVKLQEVLPKINRTLVEQLEQLLKEARDGDLRGMAGVYLYRGNVISPAWALDDPEINDIGWILGGLTKLEWSLMNRVTNNE